MEKCSAVLFVANTADELASLVRAPSAVHEVHAPLGIGGKMESKMDDYSKLYKTTNIKCILKAKNKVKA